MAKGNQKYERQGIEKEQAKYGAEYDSFMNQFLGRKEAPAAPAAGSDKLSAMGAGPGSIGIKRRGGLPVTGQAAPRLEESSRYSDMLAAGKDERDYLSTGLRGMAETGGMSDTDIGDFRSRYQSALGGGPAQAKLSDFTEERGRYRDFADTGGYSAGDIQRTRAQAARSAPSFYNALRDQQGIAASRMGANAGAGAGLDMKMARQAAQGSAQDKLAANIGLAESQREGKKFGIQGLESTGTTMGNQSLEQAGLNNQYNIGAANVTAGAEGDILGMRQKGQIAGFGGLQDLYGQSYAPENEFNKTWLDAVGASSQSAKGNRDLQLKNDEVNRSKMMENIIGMTGAVAGGMTGMGGIMNAVGGMAGKAGGSANSPLPMNTGGAGQYMQNAMSVNQMMPGGAPTNPAGMFNPYGGYQQNIGAGAMAGANPFAPGYTQANSRLMNNYNFGGR